mgnify:FL=1
MNFSEYTLLSVGDSFSFGQGTIEHYPDRILPPGEIDIVRQEWRKECNSNSYVSHIGKNLGFKQVINLGLPAGTNELSLINADTWISQNKQEKVFLLFSLTDPQRQIYFNNSRLSTFKSSDNKRLDEKKLQYYYTVMNNDISLTFKHFHFRKRLKDFINAHNLKYYVFSPFDAMDFRIVKRLPVWNNNIKEGMDHWNKLSITEDFLQWMNNIQDDKTLGDNYLTINKLSDITNYKTVYAWLNNTCNPLSSYDNQHYNTEAHIKISQLISAQIQQNNA